MANRKLLLAKVRNGNYAHAGEEEAIEIAMSLIPKNSNQLLLDVGCGLGGTADYLKKHGWGNVVGIDIDPNMISQAKSFYPDLNFYETDAIKLDTYFDKLKFDVIYSFNAFFSFPEQEQSLSAMSKVASKNGKLIIFDYSSPDFFSQDNLFYDRNSCFSKIFLPINMKEVDNVLLRTGWHLQKTINLTAQFEKWYLDVINKMEKEKNVLMSLYGQDTFDDLHKGYIQLLNLIKMEKVGGVVIFAIKLI